MKKRKIALAALVSTLCCGSLLTVPASTYIAAQEETSMAEEPADQSTFFEAEEHQEETVEESSFEEAEKENGLPESQENRVFDESWMNKEGEESEIPDLHQPEASDHRMPELSIEPDLILSTESAATFNTSAKEEMSKVKIVCAGKIEAKLNSLKSTFPHGKYWNHTWNGLPALQSISGSPVMFPMNTDSTIKPDTVSSSPCTTHGWSNGSEWKKAAKNGDTICNKFANGAQCSGFAHLIFYKLFGIYPVVLENNIYYPVDSAKLSSGKHPARFAFGLEVNEESDTYLKNLYAQKISGGENCLPGDLIVINNGYDHKAIVRKVNSNGTYDIVDGNGTGKGCQISWTNAAVPPGKIKYHIRASNYSAVQAGKTFKIRYNGNGATSGSMSDQTIYYGYRNVTRKNSYSRTGYTFQGWNVRLPNGTYVLDQNGKTKKIYANGTPVYTTTSENGKTVTFEAVWKPNTFTVQYNANGGKGTMSPTRCTYGKDNRTSRNTFTRSGFHFKYWYVRRSDQKWICTKKDSSGNLQWGYYTDLAKAKQDGYAPHPYANETTVSKTSTKNGDTVSFYAQWEKDETPRKTIAASDVSGISASYPWTGSAVCPKPTVRVSGVFLTENQDYTLSYAQNTDPGSAALTVTGKGNYTGSVQVNFRIVQQPSQPTAQRVTMFRLYNPNSGEHFYTAKVHERDYLASIGWHDEGTGWIAPENSQEPVYRLYNANEGDHHYTRSQKERDYLIGVGWNDEGIGWYSAAASGLPLLRQYNPNARNGGSHNYTVDVNEHSYLISHGWNDEGIGWYGLR